MKVQFISITNSVLKTLILARQYKDRRQLRLDWIKIKRPKEKALKIALLWKTNKILKKNTLLGQASRRRNRGMTTRVQSSGHFDCKKVGKVLPYSIIILPYSSKITFFPIETNQSVAMNYNLPYFSCIFCYYYCRCCNCCYIDTFINMSA